MLIQYITNIKKKESSGGWSGMNQNIFNCLLNSSHDIIYTQIDKPLHMGYDLLSKLQKLLSVPRIYPSFTKERLNKIGQEVKYKLKSNADMLFFHGATSWILSDLNKPYCVYLDADVKTYVDVYQSSNNFRKKQLDFIYRKESEFLNKADKVFFTSEWAQNQAVKNLGLIGDNLMVLPPNAEPQFSKIIYDKANYILFVGHDFIGKGGNYVAQAIKKYNDCNELKMRLKIVGQLPPSDILSEDFVDYVGRIDKSKISDQKKLAELYQNAMCFIMPTSRDMTPLVLLEAMSFGCPVISMDKFGISEMLKGGSAGLLIQTDFDIIGQLVDSLHKIIKDVSLRKALIDAGSIQVRSKYSREKTYQLLLKTINKIK